MLRSFLSLDDYKRQGEQARSEQTKPVQFIIHAVTTCYCGEVPYPRELSPTEKVLRCVLLIDSSLVENGSEERSRYLTAWDYTNGDWYYLLVEEGEECPRPDG